MCCGEGRGDKYSEPFQTSKMENFGKIATSFYPIKEKSLGANILLVASSACEN